MQGSQPYRDALTAAHGEIERLRELLAAKEGSAPKPPTPAPPKKSRDRRPSVDTTFGMLMLVLTLPIVVLLGPVLVRFKNPQSHALWVAIRNATTIFMSIGAVVVVAVLGSPVWAIVSLGVWGVASAILLLVALDDEITLRSGSANEWRTSLRCKHPFVRFSDKAKG
jgi:hypothetical protein